MFDFLRNQPGAGGFSAEKRTDQPGLETLEDRAVPAVIGGVVYQDLNNNGIRETGEVGISGSTMELRNAQGQVVASTITDSLGRYAFTTMQGVDTAPKEVSYELTFQEARTNLTRSGSLPKFNSSLGTLTSVEIIAEGYTQSNVVLENLEEQASSLTAELNNQIRFTVGGTTLSGQKSTELESMIAAFDGQADLQGTSAKDFGTTRLDALNGQSAGSRVTLSSSADLANFQGAGTLNVTQNATVTSCACGPGNLLAMIRSNAAGKVKVVYHYTPTNTITPGSYTIVQTNQPSGFTDGMETKNNRSTITNSNHTDYIQVGVVTNSDRLVTNYFGELRTGSISGRVYHDVDRSGSFNGSDAGLAGVTVLLTGTDVYGNAVNRTTTTVAGGMYSFESLAAGTYTIREIQPSGYQQGTNTVGNYSGSIVGDTITLTLPANGAATNYNFGEVTTTPTTRPPDPITDIQWPSKFFLIGGNRNGFTW